MKTLLSILFCGVFYLFGGLLGIFYLVNYDDLNIMTLINNEQILSFLLMICFLLAFEFFIFSSHAIHLNCLWFAKPEPKFNISLIMKRIKEDEEQLKLFKQGRLSKIQ